MRASFVFFLFFLGSADGLQNGAALNNAAAGPTTCRRRDALRALVMGTVSGLELLSRQRPALATTEIPEFSAYRVIPDAGASLNPSLQSVQSETFLKQLSSSTNGGALWLGEHHNSLRDHRLQTTILREMRQIRGPDTPIAIGLEQVQVQFQPVLDDYTNGKITLEQMKERVEWDKRWTWPFATYQPIFEVARECKISLVALNVNSEDLIMVEKGGLPGLGRERLGQYILDGQGFADFTRPREYMTYVDYVIRPAYDIHDQMGLLRYAMSGEKLDEKMTFRNFYSGRILWDEAMASAAYTWTKKNEGGILVGLVGADHVKFQNGIPGRYRRMAGEELSCSSVLLNPTLIDTRQPGSVATVPGADSSQYPDRLTLQLRYLKDDVDSTSPAAMLAEATGGVMPLADFLLIG